MARVRFQCPECGFGDHEVGHLAAEDDVCIVCLEEQGRQIRVECWEGVAIAREMGGAVASDLTFHHICGAACSSRPTG